MVFENIQPGEVLMEYDINDMTWKVMPLARVCFPRSLNEDEKGNFEEEMLKKLQVNIMGKIILIRTKAI